MTTETLTEQKYYQAIGTIYGTPIKDDNFGWAMEIQGNKYRLFIPPYKYRAWLKEMDKPSRKPLYFLVYPSSKFLPKQDPILYFQVCSWNTENQWGQLNVFTLKGLWQFIPQTRRPVLSIYRNKGSKDPLGLYKASHIPIIMRREDCNPFKFSLKNKDKIERFFVQAQFVFLPKRNAFGWKKDLNLPTSQIPKYRKPEKLKSLTKT